MDLIGTIIGAFLFSALLLRALYPFAPAIGMMDQPGERRRVHRHATPRIGGLAIYLGVLFAALYPGFVFPSHAYGLAGATLLVLVGALDDIFRLPAWMRLLAQILAALILTLGCGLALTSLGDLFGLGPVELGVLAVPFTVFAIVGIINAVNMIDGLDGLAGGLVLIALLGTLAATPTGGVTQGLILVTVAAILPYLACNLEVIGCKRRKVFLGDAGSMLLGYLLVWALLDSVQTPGGLTPVTALWLVAIPLSDTLAVIARRLLQRRRPFSPDRGHLHHLLARLFHCQRDALVVMLSLGALLSVIGITGFHLGLPDGLMFFMAMLIFLMYLVFLAFVSRLYRRLQRRRAQGLREMTAH